MDMGDRGMGGDMHNGMHGGDHMMTPYLFGDKRDFFVLFQEAKISSAGALAIALVVSFFFGILATIFSEYSKGVEECARNSEKRVSGILLFSSITFAIRVLLHYIAMLIVMSMNIWLLLVVVAGHAAGYLASRIMFKSKRTADAEHC